GGSAASWAPLRATRPGSARRARPGPFAQPLRAAHPRRPCRMSDETFVDLIPDELSLARAQLAAGLLGMAEGVLRRHIARLDAGGRGAFEELDVARELLAETLWRQGGPLAGGAAVDAIRAGSLERRRPIVMLVEAE